MDMLRYLGAVGPEAATTRDKVNAAIVSAKYGMGSASLALITLNLTLPSTLALIVV